MICGRRRSYCRNLTIIIQLGSKQNKALSIEVMAYEMGTFRLLPDSLQEFDGKVGPPAPLAPEIKDENTEEIAKDV